MKFGYWEVGKCSNGKRNREEGEKRKGNGKKLKRVKRKQQKQSFVNGQGRKD